MQKKLLRKHKRACKSSWSQIGNLKSFTLTFPWNLAKPVKIFPGIIVRRHHRSKTNGIAERAVRRVKEGTSAVLLQSGLDENWWADSMECYTYLRNVQDLLSGGKTTYEGRFGNHLKDRSFRLVHWLSILYLCERPVKNPSIWKESLTWIVLRIRFVRVEFGRVTYWLQTLRSWKRWTHQKSTLKDSMRRK